MTGEDDGEEPQRPASEQATRKAVDNKVGRRIATRRLALGLSLEELADLVGLPAEIVLQIEAGEQRPEAALLAAFAHALGCSVMEFFTPIE